MKIGRYLVVFILMIGMLIVFGKRGLIDNYAMQERLMALKKTNKEILIENKELMTKVTLLKNDLQYMEMVARNELGMVRKGDLVYRYLK